MHYEGEHVRVVDKVVVCERARLERLLRDAQAVLRAARAIDAAGESHPRRQRAIKHTAMHGILCLRRALAARVPDRQEAHDVVRIQLVRPVEGDLGRCLVLDDDTEVVGDVAPVVLDLVLNMHMYVRWR